MSLNIASEPRRRPPPRSSTCLRLCLSLCLLALLVPSIAASAPPERGDRITASTPTSLRGSPRDDARILTPIAEGDTLTIVNADRYWARVRTSRGRDGWVNLAATSAAYIPPPVVVIGSGEQEARTCRLLATTDIRSLPRVEALVVGELPRDCEVNVIERQEDWSLVRTQPGLVGWVPTSLLPQLPARMSPVDAGRLHVLSHDAQPRLRSGSVISVRLPTAVRLAPNDDAAVMARLAEGDVVTVDHAEQYWARVRTTGGDAGWILLAATSAPTIPPAVAVVSDGYPVGGRCRLLTSLDLSTEPRLDAPVVASIGQRGEVTVVDRSGAWTLVRTDAGMHGWVPTDSLPPPAQ